MSAHIPSAGQSITFISPSSTLSFIKKNFTLMCFVFLPLDICPFFVSSRVLILSWYSPLHYTSYPCSCMKCSNHNISGINMSAMSSSVSMELCMFSFTFLEQLVVAPFPIVNTAPPRPLQSPCTLCEPSTYHYNIPRFSMLNFSFRYFVPFKYLSTLISFPQLSLSGSFMLVVRNAAAV